MSSAWKFAALLVLAGLASCSKREAPKEAGTAEKIAGAPTAGKSAPAVAAASSPAEAPPVPGADIAKIAQGRDAFKSMVESLRSYAGAEVEMNTNRVDLDSFVQGKSEEDLLLFAEESAYTSPFAALQVYEYLLKNSREPDTLLEAASWYVGLVSNFGDDEAWQTSVKALDMLHRFYDDPSLTQLADPAKREWALVVMQKHWLLLGLDDAEWMRIATSARDHGRSAVEESYADSFEALTRIDEGDFARARSLIERIRERNVYGDYFADKETIDSWLDTSDFEAQARDVRRIREGGVKINQREWARVKELSAEQKILRYQGRLK